MSFNFDYSSRSNNSDNIEVSPHILFANLFEEGISCDNPSLFNFFESILEERINIPLPNGELPLHYAIRQRASNVLMFLLKHPQIEIGKKDDQGLTMLDHLFLTDEEFKIWGLSLFFKKTIEDVQGSNHDLSLAQIKAIQEEINRNVGEFNRAVSPLHAAALSGNIAMIESLIQAGADLNIFDGTGYTPLHYAVFGKGESFAAARFLIENGADPLVVNAGKPSSLALMMSIARQRSADRDPLKLDILQQLLCACTILSWVQSCCGNEADLSAFVLQRASSFLFSAMTIDQVLKIYNASEDLKSFLKSSAGLGFPMVLSALDYVPYIGELSLVLRTYMTGQSVWQGIKSAWRNRWLDPVKAFKVVSVNATNASLNAWNVYQRVQYISNSYLKTLSETFLAKNDCEEALKIASSIKKYPLRDQVLLNVATQCAQHNVLVAEAAANKIKTPFLRDLGMTKIFNTFFPNDLAGATEIAKKMDDAYKNDHLKQIKDHYLANGQCDEALQVTKKFKPNIDWQEALKSIAVNPRCAANALNTSFTAAAAIQDFKIKDQSLLDLSTHLVALGLYQDALRAAKKISFQSSKGEALMKIVADQNCMENHLNITIEAAKKLPAGMQDQAWLSIQNHYLTQNQWAEALDLADNKLKGETRDYSLKEMLSHPIVENNSTRRIEVISKLDSHEDRDAAFGKLINYLFDNQQSADAGLEACLKISSETLRDSFLYNYYDDYLKQGRCDEALKFVGSFSNKNLKRHCLNEIIGHPNFFKEYSNLNVIKNFYPNEEQRKVFEDLFQVSLENNHTDFAQKIVKELDREYLINMVKNNRLINYPQILPLVLNGVDPLEKEGLVAVFQSSSISNFLHLGECEKAMEVAKEVATNFTCIDLLSKDFRNIALNDFCQKKYPKIALKAALSIVDCFERDFILKVQMENFFISGHYEDASQAGNNMTIKYQSILLGKFINNQDVLKHNFDLIFEVMEKNLEKIPNEDLILFFKNAFILRKGEIVFNHLSSFNESQMSFLLETTMLDLNCAKNHPDLVVESCNLINYVKTKRNDVFFDSQIDQVVENLLSYSQLSHSMQVVHRAEMQRPILQKILNYIALNPNCIDERFVKVILEEKFYQFSLENLSLFSSDQKINLLKIISGDNEFVTSNSELILESIRTLINFDDGFVKKFLTINNYSFVLSNLKLFSEDQFKVILQIAFGFDKITETHPKLILENLKSFSNDQKINKLNLIINNDKSVKSLPHVVVDAFELYVGVIKATNKIDEYENEIKESFDRLFDYFRVNNNLKYIGMISGFMNNLNINFKNHVIKKQQEKNSVRGGVGVVESKIIGKKSSFF